MFNQKEIKEKLIELGYDFDKWKTALINQKRLQIIDKDKHYYNEWELQVLNDEFIKILYRVKPSKTFSPDKAQK
ncbi:hypothetical protein NGC89_02545 [Staphylococcus xylosus]|uniref:hypothetical protein n=1 Tax=Staphylococcus xylosus TaxID=1288 RepID=UPI002DBD5F4C|nr:hypothetical protein [Staphylococcus xylosus]MEB7800345.1 hypothetical protein [Staphylococcus xylosus]